MPAIAIPFDSLGHFEKLKNDGFSEAQARVQVEAMQGVLQAYDDATRKDLATKGDLANAKHEILKWMVTGMLAQTALLVALMAYLK